VCNKCDLYREEDEKEVLRVAREKVEKEWKEGEGRNVKIKLDMVETLPGSALVSLLDLKMWETWLDYALERLVVIVVH
jgi:hypothetical protein